MGKNTIKFRCVSCGHCCTDVVCLPTPWDVIRVAKATGLHPRDFLEFLEPDEVTGVSKSDPTWLKCGKKRYIMAMYRDAKHGCYFLRRKAKTCKIYEDRPILCRLYPFKLHETRDGEFKKFTLHDDVECPKHRDGEMAAAPLYALWEQDLEHQEDYNTLVKIFNRRPDKNKKPEDFIGLFVEDRRG